MMDGKNTKKKRSSTSWCWTNERHQRFLNSIEASFVRAMFENNTGSDLLRLDRHIPDSSDSTQDLPKERRRRFSTSDAEAEAEKKNKILLSKRLLSNDQVVPEFEIRRDNKDDKDHVDVCA